MPHSQSIHSTPKLPNRSDRHGKCNGWGETGGGLTRVHGVVVVMMNGAGHVAQPQSLEDCASKGVPAVRLIGLLQPQVLDT